MRSGPILPSEGKRTAGSIKSFILPGKFGLGAAYSGIVRQTSGYTPVIGKGESDAKKLRNLKSFLFNDCFFSSLACSLCGRIGGICVEGCGSRS